MAAFFASRDKLPGTACPRICRDTDTVHVRVSTDTVHGEPAATCATEILKNSLIAPTRVARFTVADASREPNRSGCKIGGAPRAPCNDANQLRIARRLVLPPTQYGRASRSREVLRGRTLRIAERWQPAVALAGYGETDFAPMPGQGLAGRGLPRNTKVLRRRLSP